MDPRSTDGESHALYDLAVFNLDTIPEKSHSPLPAEWTKKNGGKAHLDSDCLPHSTADRKIDGEVTHFAPKKKSKLHELSPRYEKDGKS